MKSKKYEPTTREKALIRQIITKAHPNELRRFAWDELVKWSGVDNCRLAVQAIVSCALVEDSPLFEKAQKWIADHKDNRLMLAVCMEQSSYSPKNRQRVYDNILDHHLINYPLSFWQSIKKSSVNDFGWYAENTGLDNWKNFPPLTHLTDYCRWITEDTPADALPMRIFQMRQESRAQVMFELRYQIVKKTVELGDFNSFLGCWDTAFRYSAEIVRCLTDYQPHHCENDSYNLVYYKYMYQLAKAFVEIMPTLNDAEKAKFAEKLMQADLSHQGWVVSIANEICAVATNQDLIVDFVSWIIHNPKSRDNSIEAMRYSREKLDLSYSKLPITIGNLPVATIAKILLEISQCDDKSEYYDKYLRSACQEALQKNPEAFFQVINQDHEKSSQLCGYAMLDLIREIGLDRMKLILAKWLKNDELLLAKRYMRKREDISSLAGFVVNAKIVLKNSLLSTKELLAEEGYTLTPEDIIDEDFVSKLLDGTKVNGKMKFSYSTIWLYSQWRDTLLKSKHGTQYIIKSILISIPPQSDTAMWTWFTKYMNPALRKNKKLRIEYFRIMWEDATPKEAGVMWKAIICDSSHRRWLKSKTIQSLARKNMIRNCSMTNGNSFFTEVLSPEEQLDIFFETASSMETGNNLPMVEKFSHLFVLEHDQDRLKKWLMINFDKINVSDWLGWVDYYKFAPDPKIKRLLYKILDKYSGFSVEKAINILKSIN